MNENKLPKLNSVEEWAEFVDTHDMGEYFDEMPEVEFNIDIQRRYFLVSVDETLMEKLTALARAQHISTQNLVHSWLEEKVA